MKSSRAGGVLWASVIVTALAVLVPRAAAAEEAPPARLLDLMAEGRTETDLGHFGAAIAALEAVAEAPDAPPALRQEALVRLGVARRGAGDFEGALQAFQRVVNGSPFDADTRALLVQALGAALPSAKRWAEIWPRVTFAVDRSQPERPTLSVAWPDAAASPRRGGDHVSISLTDADLGNLFRMIADVSGLNVVVFPGVHGKVTLQVNDEPWERFLELALAPNGYAFQREDNVVLIAAPEQLPSPRRFSGQRIDVNYQDAELRKSLAELAARGSARTEIDPTVAGRLTIKLIHVRWDQAFGVLAAVNGLEWTQEGDLIKVSAPTR